MVQGIDGLDLDDDLVGHYQIKPIGALDPEPLV